MLIPSCFFGPLKNVKRELRKVGRKLVKGASLEEAVSAYELLDTDAYPESILYVRRTSAIACTDIDFHFPWITEYTRRLDECISDDSEKVSQEVFLKLLSTDWGVLCLCESQSSWFWNPFVRHENTFDRRSRWIPYIKAMLQYWDTYVGLGNRFWYYKYIREEEINYNIWFQSDALWYVLANMKIPLGVPLGELPDMDLQRLVDENHVLEIDVTSLPWLP